MATELPAAISTETLLYQNRAAMKQLSEYRKEADRLADQLRISEERLKRMHLSRDLAIRFWSSLTINPDSFDIINAAKLAVSSDPSTDEYLTDLQNHMNESVTAAVSTAELEMHAEEIAKLRLLVEELKLDNDRLRKQIVKLSTTTPVLEPVVHMDASTDSPELRAEIALLRTELDKRGGDGYETVLRSLEMIHQERLSTRNRAHAVEAEIISLRQKFAEKLELIESSASAAQDAFLLEISKLAHETANAKAEAERQRILTLEAQARLDALAERETAMSGDDQVLRLHALLKKNDDLHNKLLTSHIQLQQQFGLKEVAEALERRNLEMESLTESSGREVAALKEELLAAKARASRAESEISSLLAARVASESQTAVALRTAAEAASITESLRTALGRSEADNAAKVKQLEKEKRRSAAGGSSDLVSLQLEEYRKKVKCSLCGVRDKEVALSKCLHCFCRTCVDENLLQARNRKCPLCGLKFAGEMDVRPVHLVTN